MHKVTVIITTYKRPELLRDAIKSVLAQTFSDFELIVVDDASSDGTADAVKDFQDNRISYVCQPKNMGDAVAKNTGIKLAKGEYVITLDDDDLMAPNALEELVSSAEESAKDVCGVYGWSWWIYGGGKTLRMLVPKEKATFNKILSKQFFTNILLKREVFDKVGFYDESLKSSYDHDFYLRLSKVYKFEFVTKILFINRLQDKHLSEISVSHMKRYEEVTRRFEPKAKKKGVFLLGFVSPRFYMQASILKHKVATALRFFVNPELKRQIKEIKKSIKSEEIVL